MLERNLARAVLYFDGTTAEARSGKDGRFQVRREHPADTVLVIRQIGYVPRRILVPASTSAAAIDVGEIQLRPIATALDRIAIEAEDIARFPSLEDFYRRKHVGASGFFMAPEEIARASARKTSNLLERSVKIATVCNDAVPWQKGRGGTGPSDCTATNSRIVGASRCELEVWVDGVRTDMKVDDIAVRTVVALEVYNGPASVPTEFGSGFCGVVALWTSAPGAQSQVHR